MSDWTNIELERDVAEPVDPGSYLELEARLETAVLGRCPHGFELGSGLCQVKACGAFGEPKKVRTCCSCRKPYRSSHAGKGRCDACNNIRRRREAR